MYTLENISGDDLIINRLKKTKSYSSCIQLTDNKRKRINMLRQRLCGILLFIITMFAMAASGEMSAAFIIIPFSLYIVFTRKQVLDFEILKGKS